MGITDRPQIKRAICFLAIISFLGYTNCSDTHETSDDIISNDQSNNYNIVLEKESEFTISGSDDLRLDMVLDVISFNKTDSLILWVNTIQNQVFVTDTEGNIQTYFGRKGAGPSEFRDVTATGFDENDQLIIYDWQLDLIKTFDMDGDLVNELFGLVENNLWIRSRRIFISDGYLHFGIQAAVERGEVWDTNVIARFDEEANLLNTFGGYGDDLKQRELYYIHPDFTMDTDKGTFFITHSSYHIIKAVSSEGKTLARFGVQPENFRYADDQVVQTDTREERDQKNLHQSSSGPPHVTKDHFYFYFFNYTEEFFDTIDRSSRTYNPNTRDSYMAVYNNAEPYNYYGEAELPYTLLGATKNGKIYLLENDDPDNFTIAIYNLKVEATE